MDSDSYENDLTQIKHRLNVYITDASSGFDVDTNKVTLIDRDGKIDSLPLLTKREVADRILDKVVGMLGKKAKR